jgi:hypothetical protein
MHTSILIAITALAAAAGLERTADRSNPTLQLSDVDFKGRAALRAVDVSNGRPLDALIPLAGSDFANGSIELDVAGLPAPGAAADVRGFIGVAFRVQADPGRYEAFYIRPTNGRADDQLRRNHATQYIGMPDFPWHQLRKDQPGVYESYADLVAGEWTRLRVEVDGARARLFVNGAGQPALIVNDLKLGADARGGVALWVGPGTEGYFANVRVTPRR